MSPRLGTKKTNVAQAAVGVERCRSLFVQAAFHHFGELGLHLPVLGHQRFPYPLELIHLAKGRAVFLRFQYNRPCLTYPLISFKPRLKSFLFDEISFYMQFCALFLTA